MSSNDDEDADVRVEEAEECDDEDDDGPVPPCCGIFIGLVCLVVSVVGLFWNEGRYVERLQGLNKAAKLFVIPCDDGCVKCDVNQVKEVDSEKKRALKKGDLVYMACNLHDLDDVSKLSNDFKPSELAGLVKAETWADKAGRFAWKFEMFQQSYEAWSGQVTGASKEELGRKCLQEKRARCDKSKGVDSWTKGGDNGRSECTKLQRQQCLEKADKCDWFWSCPKIQVEAECRALEPSGECQWADEAPVIVKGQECIGCCPTDNTWKFACRPKQRLEAVSRQLQQAEEEPLLAVSRQLQQAEEEPLLAAEHRQWPGLAAPPRALSRGKTELKGDCKADICTFSTAWSTQTKPKPPEWKKLPLTFGNLQYAEPPAYNLKYLSSGAHSAASKVRFGANSGQSESVSIGKLEAKVFPEQSLVPVHLKQHTATTQLPSRKDSKEYTLPPASVKLTMTKLDRSDPSSTWSAANSNVGGGHCQAGCICSVSGTSRPEAGDLRVCFEQSSTVSVSLMAKADADANGGWTLVEDTSLGGVLIRLNERVPAKDLVEAAKTAAFSELQVLRFVFPIVMWLGFYCCLSPILWVIDTCGDALETIPCFGGLFGGLADCVETLAECAICMVSCGSALSCSLLVASFAWIWFRPYIGLPMLGAAILFFVTLGGFAMSRRGMSKVRRRSKRTAREPQVNAAVEMPVVAAPADVVQQPVQFAVVCPGGIGADRLVQVQAPDGRLVQVQVPEGVVEGQQFVVQA